MDADEFLESIREDQRTPLSRLGSSKALYALTEGEMEDAAVRAAMADLAHHTAEVLEDWDLNVAATAVTFAREHREDVAESHDPGPVPAAVDALAELEGDAERLGGLLGWTLVAGKVTEQATGYFTGQADPRTASTFRSHGDDLESLRADVLEALADRDDSEERAVAERGATAVIEAAYGEYVDTLESLGVNPKPVC